MKKQYNVTINFVKCDDEVEKERKVIEILVTNAIKSLTKKLT